MLVTQLSLLTLALPLSANLTAAPMPMPMFAPVPPDRYPDR